jgi:hypothetical protein
MSQIADLATSSLLGSLGGYSLVLVLLWGYLQAPDD